MPILYHKEQKMFHLKSKSMSYIIQIIDGFPLHIYWGKGLKDNDNLHVLSSEIERDSLAKLPQEYPQYGSGDYRHPAYQIELPDGSRITELMYDDHTISGGKPTLDGLPSLYVESEKEATTLILKLKDSYSGIVVNLKYTIYEHEDVLTRSSEIYNSGISSLTILNALSASVDFQESDFYTLSLSGASRRERHIEKRKINSGSMVIESRRGASSHHLNPFLAMAYADTNEDYGEVFGFSLVYSGNFKAEVEVDQWFTTRVSIGINPFDFSWKLIPGETFQTPEAVMVYSSSGIGEMSRIYHRLFRTRLCRGIYRDKVRPILINNWEATYFNFNEEKIKEISTFAKELGIELLVLDDGWFGTRNDDTTSLGDWTENKGKLPNGLHNLANDIIKQGVKFGIWIEPEMISPDSELYRKHPDWCLHVEGRRRTEYRHQLVLDLSRKEVREYIINSLRHLFSSIPVSYCKWDMNRNITESGSLGRSPDQQKETSHRYILGLYEILELITKEFPEILFEGCAGGGGRFDPGMLYYMPQIWTSDNTDAVERQKIQYGSSLVYPISSMGAHVSAIPNHQVGRSTSLETRGHVAMSGNFGYELDLSKLTDSEKVIVQEQIKFNKDIRGMIQVSDLYRLKSPFKGNEAAWLFITPDKREVIVFYFKTLAVANIRPKTLRLKGLDPTVEYLEKESNVKYMGDQLMYSGLPVKEIKSDFISVVYQLISTKDSVLSLKKIK